MIVVNVIAPFPLPVEGARPLNAMSLAAQAMVEAKRMAQRTLTIT